MKYSPVSVPKCCVFKHSDSGTYVYLTKNVSYSKQKKRSLPSRILIGKLDDNGLLLPNKNYIDIFGEDIELKIPDNRSDYISTGLYSVLQSIANNLNISSLLDSIFDKIDSIFDKTKTFEDKKEEKM